MQRDRAWRRSQRDRKINEVFQWMKDRDWYIWNHAHDYDTRMEQLHLTALRRHGAPKECSRFCCGNPRKHFGTTTLGEYRHFIECVESYTEADIKAPQLKKRKW